LDQKEIQECNEWAALSPTMEVGTERLWYDDDFLKTTSTFGWLGRIWVSRKIYVKVQLHNSLVLAVLLYGADTWPMTKSTTRQLEAAHHNVKVRELAQQGILEYTIRERRLRWAEHVMRMDSWRITRPATNWIDGKRRPGRKSNKVDIRRGGMNWEQIPDLAVDRKFWRELTISTGGTKV